MGPLRNNNEGEFYESLLVNLFERQGWKSARQESAADRGIDLIVDSGSRRYLIELKQIAEGRRDRLVPLLSQAILQVHSAAQQFEKSAIPVAIVAARHIPNSVAKQVKEFAEKYASNVGIGIIDSRGFRLFHGFGLERFNSEGEASAYQGSPLPSRARPHLFSDLNQWMLKILLAPSIPESFLSAPREEYRNGSQLAKVAGVSVMSASRFIRQLADEGFLDESVSYLRLVRIEELVQRWVNANLRRGQEIPARWVIRSGEGQLLSAIKSYISFQRSKKSKDIKSPESQIIRELPRICIGLFAAADLLGVGFVHGVGEHIYIDRPEPEALSQLGLSLECHERSPDVLIRIPENPESVFRAAVKHGAAPVSDILQVWLDVSHEPARGKEQAEQIWRRVLVPSMRSGQHAG